MCEPAPIVHVYTCVPSALMRIAGIVSESIGRYRAPRCTTSLLLQRLECDPTALRAALMIPSKGETASVCGLRYVAYSVLIAERARSNVPLLLIEFLKLNFLGHRKKTS